MVALLSILLQILKEFSTSQKHYMDKSQKGITIRKKFNARVLNLVLSK